MRNWGRSFAAPSCRSRGRRGAPSIARNRNSASSRITPSIRNLAGASEAAERYRNDPDTDFHLLAADITGLPRKDAKAVNFAKIYGAGVKKFAEMIGRPSAEAQTIYAQYDRQLPFLSQLARACQREANRHGYTLLYDGARRHWDRWATRICRQRGRPVLARGGKAAHARSRPSLVWGCLRRADIHTALNALIQGSAASHTKLWMRACWREGVVPLLQMHDGLECSVTAPEQGELDCHAGLRSGRAQGPDAGRHQVWPHLGRRPAQLGRSCKPRRRPVSVRSDHLPSGTARAASRNSRTTASACIAGSIRRTAAKFAAPTTTNGCTARCQDAFIRARMAEENIAWEAPQLAAAAETPAPLPWNIPTTRHRRRAARPAIKRRDPWTNGGGNGHGYPCGENEIDHKVAEFIYRDLKGTRTSRSPSTGPRRGRSRFRNITGRTGAGKAASPKAPRSRIGCPNCWPLPPGAKVWICEGEKDAETLAALGSGRDHQSRRRRQMEPRNWTSGSPASRAPTCSKTMTRPAASTRSRSQPR